MRRMNRQVATALAAVALILAACADDTTSASLATAPEVAAKVAAPAACSYSDISRSARAYTSSTDPLLELIRVMSQATETQSAALDVLARMAAVRDAGLAGLPADGAAVATGVFRCAAFSPVPSEAELTALLATDGSGGIFAVRGGPGDPTTPAVVPSAMPQWGAEPGGGQTWAASFGQRSLLYAYRIAFSSFTQEKPALLTPGSLDEPGTAFEMNTVPAIAALPNPLLVGVCVDDPSSYRMQSVSTIVALQTLSFCDGLASRATEEGSLRELGGRLLAFLAPRPAYAATMLIGGTGGLISGFSPKGAVDVATGQIQLVLGPLPRNLKANVPFDLTVRAISNQGNPVDGVTIRLAITGNNGVGSDGVYEPVLHAGVVTVNGGHALLEDVVINKPGGYTLRAEGYFNGVDDLPTLFVYSGLVNVKP